MASNWMPKGKGKDQAKENKKPAPQKNEFPIILATGKGKLHLSKRLMQQVNLLHDYAGNVEWSGPLFYNVRSGSINKPEDIVIDAHAMYPMDIGTSAYTEYDFEAEQTFDMHDYYPEILSDGWDMGHMHTHHNMNAYFSSTDEQELRDNTPNHAYYLSLIVNHAKKYVARLCVMGIRKVQGTASVSYKGIDSVDASNESAIISTQKVVYAIDLDVTFDDDVIPFMKEVAKIKKRKEEKKRNLAKEAANLNPNKGWDTNAWLEVNDWNKSFGKNQMGMIDVPGFDVDSDKARDFCYKLLDCNPTGSGHFRSLLIKLENSLYTMSEEEKDMSLDILQEQMDGVFDACLQEVYVGSTYVEIAENVINFLTDYQTEFELADMLICFVEDVLATKMEEAAV